MNTRLSSILATIIGSIVMGGLLYGENKVSRDEPEGKAPNRVEVKDPNAGGVPPQKQIIPNRGNQPHEAEQSRIERQFKNLLEGERYLRTQRQHLLKKYTPSSRLMERLQARLDALGKQKREMLERYPWLKAREKERSSERAYPRDGSEAQQDEDADAE